MRRTILRNRIRSAYGNKAMQSVWRNIQIKKYGFKWWRVLYILCDPKGRHALSLDNRIH